MLGKEWLCRRDRGRGGKQTAFKEHIGADEEKAQGRCNSDGHREMKTPAVTCWTGGAHPSHASLYGFLSLFPNFDKNQLLTGAETLLLLLWRPTQGNHLTPKAKAHCRLRSPFAVKRAGRYAKLGEMQLCNGCQGRARSFFLLFCYENVQLHREPMYMSPRFHLHLLYHSCPSIIHDYLLF
jgi:hypothetical protein